MILPLFVGFPLWLTDTGSTVSLLIKVTELCSTSVIHDTPLSVRYLTAIFFSSFSNSTTLNCADLAYLTIGYIRIRSRSSAPGSIICRTSFPTEHPSQCLASSFFWHFLVFFCLALLLGFCFLPRFCSLPLSMHIFWCHWYACCHKTHQELSTVKYPHMLVESDKKVMTTLFSLSLLFSSNAWLLLQSEVPTEFHRGDFGSHIVEWLGWKGPQGSSSSNPTAVGTSYHRRKIIASRA